MNRFSDKHDNVKLELFPNAPMYNTYTWLNFTNRMKTPDQPHTKLRASSEVKN